MSFVRAKLRKITTSDNDNPIAIIDEIESCIEDETNSAGSSTLHNSEYSINQMNIR